jgi:hypothetical protein
MELFHLTHHPIPKRNPLALAIAAALSFSSPLYAANFDVTKATDNGEGDVVGSLSWGILQANEQAGDDTIILKSDVTIDGVMKTLINSNIDVIGNGHFISGNNEFRPLFIKSGTVNLSNMTIREGPCERGK